jgi:sarcosine oxidase subunit gamma
MSDVLATWSVEGRSLSIRESAVAISLVRAFRDDVEIAPKLGKAFGLAWPVRTTAVADGRPMVACVAPGEWAVFATASAIRAKVEAACVGHLHHLADLSAGRRLWRIVGPSARILVARGCSLDTHPRVMGELRCAQTLFAQIPILFVAQTTGSFDVVADASFAGHLQRWFAEQAQELL